MRIAAYNVAWFNGLFDDDGTLLDDAGTAGRRNLSRAEQLAGVGTVFRALDADAIMVIEAPQTNAKRSTVTALQAFARHFGLRARAAIIGFPNNTQQEIALMYDPDRLAVLHDPRAEPQAPRFDGSFRIDLDFDATEDLVTFSKPPLELAVTTAAGRHLRMIGVHLKSKAPHGAQTRDAVLRLAIANRRKQLAQAIWLRRRIATHLAAGDSVIVLGDLNDGPGLDEYEHLFGRSSVEVVMGLGASALFDPHPQAMMRPSQGTGPTTSRFPQPEGARFLLALLDYILVSPDLLAPQPRWHIWHPFDDPACWSQPALRDALISASDHFPVTLDIDI